MTALAPTRSRTRAGLAVSLLLHAAFVAAVILSLPWKGPRPEPPSVVVTLTPPLSSPAPQPRLRPPPRLAPARPASPLAAPPPSVPPTVPVISAPTGPPAAQAPPAIGPKVRALLRGSVGCAEAEALHLTQEERDRCARMLKAHVDPNLVLQAPIDANKRAWFDATVAARNSPDHPPTLVCFGKPPHGIKLGPLPCYVEPPKGPLSEDVDVPPAPDH